MMNSQTIIQHWTNTLRNPLGEEGLIVADVRTGVFYTAVLLTDRSSRVEYTSSAASV
jgi:hypothetical protein